MIEPNPLTIREQEVLTLAKEGWSQKETAKKLFLSVETIKIYRAKVVDKLEARNITHAVIIAIRRGYLSL